MFQYSLVQSNKMPGPTIDIECFYNKNGREENVKSVAIIDTGATLSCIPKKVMEVIKSCAVSYSSTHIKFAHKNKSLKVNCYYIDLLFNKERMEKIRIIETDRDYAIIGRDILNKKTIHLYGPNQKWSYE